MIVVRLRPSHVYPRSGLAPVEAEVGAGVDHAVVVGARQVADTAVPMAVDKAVPPAVETLAGVAPAGGIYPQARDVPEGGAVSGQFLVWLVLAAQKSVCCS